MECLIHIFQTYGSSYRNKITHEAFMQAKSLNNVCLQRETHLQLINNFCKKKQQTIHCKYVKGYKLRVFHLDDISFSRGEANQ